ncbi:hypothetical protein [Nocardia pseudovaccinii]|uniref:hypothetical protein n=1 Tax=Nocardia pseudovaccinii TaxID=189540 RepID=UPI0012F52AEB|nr:hypothetical protein [Nocardia pseudovaccinii]
MHEPKWSALRRVEPPRRVLVDPRRVWVHPQRHRPRVEPVTLGEKAGSLDIRLDDEWMPAVLYAWARVALGREPTWYAEIAAVFRTNSGVMEVTLRQWVPWDAVKPAQE